MTEPFKQLDAALNRRRIHLRMNWREVADAAGISYTALRAIRRGEYRPTELTARGLDEALQWTSGSVYAILDGSPPEALEDASSEPPPSPHPSMTAPPLLSPHEALRRSVRATARELGVTPSGVSEVMHLVRQDLESENPEGPRFPPGAPKRTDLSDMVRERRLEVGLSLGEVAERAVDPETEERVMDAAWLDRLERDALGPKEYPEYPELDALAGALNLDPGDVQEAAGVQFLDIHTVWSEDGQVRAIVDGEPSAEDLEKVQNLMRLYRKAPRR